MKFKTTLIILFASQAFPVLAAPPTPLVDECGELGIMNWDNVDIPASIDRSKLRKCREHPLGGRSINKKENVFEKRYCWPYTSGTCDNGYCWYSCGRNGANDLDYWCWLARDNGYGDWIKCGNDNTCKTYPNKQCGWGSCDACECGGC